MAGPDTISKYGAAAAVPSSILGKVAILNYEMKQIKNEST